MTPSNDWDEWRNHILVELDRLNDTTELIFNRLNTIREEIAALKVKSGIWGLIGGMIPVVIALSYFILKG